MAGFLVLDDETCSPVRLADTSTDIYARHPQTGIRCAGLARNDQIVKVWLPSHGVPLEIIEAVADQGCAFVAHYVRFERSLWRHKLTPIYGWPECPPTERWHCTMAGAQSLALPGSLRKVAEVLQLAHQKSDDSIARRMSQPRRPRKGEDPAGVYFDDDPDRLQQLYDYCKKDVLCERELYLWLLHHWDQ
jgi:DNA polymerase